MGLKGFYKGFFSDGPFLSTMSPESLQEVFRASTDSTPWAGGARVSALKHEFCPKSLKQPPQQSSILDWPQTLEWNKQV